MSLCKRRAADVLLHQHICSILAMSGSRGKEEGRESKRPQADLDTQKPKSVHDSNFWCSCFRLARSVQVHRSFHLIVVGKKAMVGATAQCCFGQCLRCARQHICIYFNLQSVRTKATGFVPYVAGLDSPIDVSRQR